MDDCKAEIAKLKAALASSQEKRATITAGYDELISHHKDHHDFDASFTVNLERRAEVLQGCISNIEVLKLGLDSLRCTIEAALDREKL